MQSAEIQGEDYTNETAFLVGIPHGSLYQFRISFLLLCWLPSYFRFFALPYYLL